MKFKIGFALLLVAIVSAARMSMASPMHRLANFLDDELSSINMALENVPDENPQHSTSTWNVQNFYLRLQATVGFALPQFLSIDLIPQVELVFHRNDQTRS